MNIFGSILDKNTEVFIGIMFAYIVTSLALRFLSGCLPKDAGREFAHDGKKSAGKPRGAGFLFVIVFALTSVLFLDVDKEIVVYIILTLAAMLTGYLDDCSKAPWGEYKKGILDLAVSLMLAIAFVQFNSATIHINISNTDIELNSIVFIILATILIWASINVTNCSDGVDGLCGTLSIVTLFSIFLIINKRGLDDNFGAMILILVACLLGYLWFNATPSKMMMGDAGSRALGLFIAIAILKTQSPFLYLLVAVILIVNGGIGLIKVSLLRFCKIKILKNTITPIHDHVRKNLGWSNTQTVFKFAIIQIMISFAVVWLL